MTENRKIAAILAADVVGFSRLTGADEDRTLARLRALRSDLIDPTISVHRGRVVKRTGDGALVEFRSVVDAVRCAIEVQNAMVERNAGLPPERRIEFRIGIHLGDVVEESDGDLMGDGVNIAARLEGIGRPGEICLSEDAYRQVKGRLDLAVTDLGEQSLKNIAETMRAYSLQVGLPARPKPEKPPTRSKKWSMALPSAAAIAVLIVVATGVWYFLGTGGLPLAGVFGGGKAGPVEHSALAYSSIAVLPFDNIGGDEQAGRLADGMTEDVITNLAQFKDLLVIARNSTMAYKGKPVDIRQIGEDLDVRYVLEGSIQHQADQLRVTAQLIDASTGAHVWSERWDRPAKDMFAVQSEVAEKVAVSLGGHAGQTAGAIQRSQLLEAKRKQSADLSAYDLALLAYEQQRASNKIANVKGLEYIEKAVALDPSFAPAYVTRGWLKFQKTWLFDLPWATQIAQFEADLRMALALDPSNPEAHAGLIRYYSDKGQFAECAAEIDLALRDNPTNIAVLIVAAQQLSFLGRPEEGVAMADLALRLDPQMAPSRRDTVGSAYFYARKFARHIEVTDLIPAESLEKYTRFQRAASYAFLGRSEEAERSKADLISRHGTQIEEVWLNEGQIFARQTEQDIEHDAFRKLGFRICATAEELKNFGKPLRYPECVKT
ncbi:MAG TPA: adenylate/guanylate cyclase domain-containing protein [Roseiarcus sp.]